MPKSKKSAAQPPKSKKSTKAKSVSARQAIGLSDCAAEYADLLANPYVKSHSACIPTIPARRSRKFTSYCSGTFNAQTSNGLAAIAYSPWAMAVTNASIPPVVVTSTTSTQNGIPVTNAAGTNVFTGNSDYAGPLGSLSTVQFRLVAAGLRVQYDGPLLNAGGRIVGVEEPDHRPLNGTTFTNLSQYDEARVMRIEPDTWYQVEYRPIDDSSLRYGAYSSGMHFLEGTSAGDVRVLSVDYDDSEFQEFVGDEDNANATMAFAILPAEPGDGGKFLFEAYAHFECIGRTVRGATPSHADIVGFSAVSNVTGQLGSRAPKMNPGSASDEVNQAIGRHTVGEATQTGNSIVSGLVGLARTAIPTALEIGASLLGGPIAGRAVGGVANAAMRQIAPAVTTSGGQRLLLGAASTM